NDSPGRRFVECGKDWKQIRKGRNGGLIQPGYLAQGHFDIMREQQPVAPELVLQGQRFSLEFYPIGAGDVRTNVQLRRLLHIGMPKLEHNFRITNRKTVLVRDAAPEDECVVV